MSQKRSYLSSIFIDLDGPVLDVSQRHYLVYKNIVRRLGGRALGKNKYWGLKKEKEGLDKILQLSKINKKKAVFKKLWLNLIEKKSFLIYDKDWPSAKNALKLIRNRHRLILVTLRNSLFNLRWQLNRLGLRRYFDFVLCQKNNKGDWQVKYKLIKNSEKSYINSYLLGDTEIDIIVGKKLRMKTVALLSGIRSKNFLKSYKPDYIFNSLKEVVRILRLT